MKKLFGMIIALGLAFTTTGVYALSFGPDTLFLMADSEEECKTMGGSYTQWDEETYCTTTPETLLSVKHQRAIQIAAQKLIKIVGTDADMYDELMKLLQTYTTLFRENQETRKLAVAMFLTTTIESNITTIPDTCSTWYDGCNTCQVGENGELACTKKFCAEKEEAYCMDDMTQIPVTCTVRYDGCNTCQVMENGELACTKMACAAQQEAVCKVHEKTIVVADHTVECVGVGPMNCMLIQDHSSRSPVYIKIGDIKGEAKDAAYIKIGDIQGESTRSATYIKIGDIKGEAKDAAYIKIGEIQGESARSATYIKIGDIQGESNRSAAYIKIGDIKGESIDKSSDWEYFYDSIEGFEYIEGYEWTLLVEETHLDPENVSADASSISWKLKEVINIQAEVPETCSVRYDGCNTCSGGTDGMMACTMMACGGEPMMPYCMDEGSNNTKATDYNSSRSNKSL